MIAIVLEQGADREIWRGRLHDARLREGADFYLSVRSSLPPHQLQSRFPQLCKAGSHDDVAEVVNIALSGIAIKPLSHVPAAIPLRLENQYFALDLSHRCRPRDAGGRQLHLLYPGIAWRRET